MPIEVLHILGSAALEGTGIARMVSTLAAGLDEREYRLHACFLGADGPLAAELARSGMSVHALDWHRGARDLAGARRFWRHLRSERFSIIHKHVGGRSVRWVARAATDAALVAHVHGSVVEETGALVAPLRPGDADAVIATSGAVARHAGYRGARVVYPGVPIDDHAGGMTRPAAGRTASVIGAAGRLVRLKGHADLLRAAALLRPGWPALRVEIAGEGPERPALQDEARRLGLESQVTFLGWQTDMGAALARWDVLVQPSLDEGFGLAALEAMAAGLPVVATRVGGLPEVVEEGSTGLLVASADPSSLATALERLLRNPDLGSAMGAAGRERARAHFSVERMVTSIAEIYASLAGRAPAA
ncbi:MAG TPA: glycosyltransferase family 4 protein [Methylomirabilota bacterium]|nr:glycosyltransferase family 4 protein [Methylomirabilota bacterium]